MRRFVVIALAGVIFSAGCAAPEGPRELVLTPERYDAAFDAAIEVARKHGMTAVRRDRRNGVIETEPRIAGTMLEPWRTDNAGFSQAFENTANFQRRSVRFEFAPADAPAPPLATEGALPEPDYTGVTHAPIDLTAYDGPIRLMCIVTVERNHRPGTRPNTWTNRRLATQTIRGDVDTDLPRNFWTPVSRDEAYEARLLDRVRAMVGSL